MVAAIARMSPAGRVAGIGEGMARLRRRGWYSVRLTALVPNRMCAGVDAAGDVALVTDRRVVGAGPAQPRNDPVVELIGVQVRGNGAAAGRTGLTRVGDAVYRSRLEWAGRWCGQVVGPRRLSSSSTWSTVVIGIRKSGPSTSRR